MDAPQYLVHKIETCGNCKGKGFVEIAHCRECGRILSEADMIALDHKDDLPCGHKITQLDEADWCIECEGQGKIEAWIPLQQALREIGVRGYTAPPPSGQAHTVWCSCGKSTTCVWNPDTARYVAEDHAWLFLVERNGWTCHPKSYGHRQAKVVILSDGAFQC